MNEIKPPATRVEAGIHVDLAGKQTYGEYLNLDLVLSAHQCQNRLHQVTAHFLDIRQDYLLQMR